MLPPLIKSKIGAIAELCRTCHVRRLYVFGSSVSGKFRLESDVDLLIELNDTLVDPVERGGVLLEFYLSMRRLLERDIDILTVKSLKNPFLISEVNSTKVLIYDEQRTEVLV